MFASLDFTQPNFPTYNKSAADDFESILEKIVENNVGKGEISYHELFLFLLQQCFQKTSAACAANVVCT